MRHLLIPNCCLSLFLLLIGNKTLKRVRWFRHSTTAGMSYAWTLLLLTTASVAVHGLLLGLPMPSQEIADEPESLPLNPTRVMDVAVLPPTTQANEEADEEPQPAAIKPEESVRRSPQPPQTPTAPVASEPEPLPETDPTAPSDAADTALDTSDEEGDPLDGLPIDQGSGALTEHTTNEPLSLEEQLQDLNAYQYDGRKSLGFLEANTELLQWGVGDQTLPSKVEPLEVPYRLADQCLDTAPELGLLVVVLNPDGTIARGPEVISSTGYGVLDEQAKAIVTEQAYPFPERDQTRAYSVEVKVIYPDSCP